VVVFDPFNLQTGVGLDWVICAGESGPGARPFNMDWAYKLRQQCAVRGVPFFMKQMGSNPVNGPNAASVRSALKDPKGGDPAEWPEWARVREFPV
jgi:protein gp37